jgi:hypothetical protein
LAMAKERLWAMLAAQWSQLRAKERLAGRRMKLASASIVVRAEVTA